MAEPPANLDKKIEDLTATVNRLSQQFSDYVSNRTDCEGDAVAKKNEGDLEEDFTQDFSKDENEDRGNWTGRLDFLLACLGYAVGLGNVWRFPYLCYKNGGAVFFIPYVIMLTFVGMPIFFLELSLGQYTSSGPFTCWEMSKLFKGLGVGMVCVSALVATYYNMIIAWSLYYLFASFTSDLPWQYCHHDWNSEWCALKMNSNITSAEICENYLFDASSNNGVCYNGTTPVGIYNSTLAKENNLSAVVPSEEYLTRYVLGVHNANGIEDLGKLKWQLVLCLLLAWIIVIASLIKGVKSSGKVVYFTALFPYAVLIILFIKGLTLDGHYEGIEFYILKPDLSKLSDAQVWKDAAVQIFFSLSASWGGLIALSSYNRFHNDVLRDSIIVSLGNCLTSFFAGFVIFSFLGFLAKEYSKSVEDVVASGVGLAFVVYPDAVTRLPISPLWAILFFLMLISLGLDSEFALVETVTTAFMDQFPKLRNHKSLVICFTGLLFFLLGLVMCTEGGSYVLSLMDNYSGGWNVLFIALLECICISYVYGAFRFKEDIQLMIGRTGCGCFPWNGCFPWWLINWAFFTPLGVLFIMVFSWVNYKPYTDGSYDYPVWGDAIGWIMTLTVIAAIIITPIVLMCTMEGSIGQRFMELVRPSKFWGPALPKHRRLVKHLGNFEIDPWDEGMNRDDVKMGHENEGYNNYM